MNNAEIDGASYSPLPWKARHNLIVDSDGREVCRSPAGESNYHEWKDFCQLDRDFIIKAANSFHDMQKALREAESFIKCYCHCADSDVRKSTLEKLDYAIWRGSFQKGKTA